MKKDKTYITKEKRGVIMKLWEKIVIGIGIILSIFIIMTIRKFVIYTNLNYLNKEKQSIGNIYTKITVGQDTVEKYRKGDIEKLVAKKYGKIITQVMNSEYWIVYTDDGVNKTRTEKQQKKSERAVMLEPENTILNFAYFTTLPEKIWSSICSHITTETIDGQEYYVVSGRNVNFIYSERTKNIKAYINKNTGLIYKVVETINENGNIRDEIAIYEYKFNVVTDEDVAELDEQEYKIRNF